MLELKRQLIVCFPFSLSFPYFLNQQPEVESKGARFRLLDQLKDELGVSYIFDGMMLFLTKHVGDIELQAKARDDSVVRVILNLTKKLDRPTLQVCVQSHVHQGTCTSSTFYGAI